MAILALTSTSGSPGVTSLAVGLALAWPRSVLLADCDPGAHQAVLAGFLGGQSANGKGLLRVAEAHRDRRPLVEVIIDQAIPLAEDDEFPRTFLPGFSRPGSAGLFGGVWSDLVEAFARLNDVGIDVIVDAGRLSPPGLPQPLVDSAALIGLTLRSHLRSVMSARVHIPTLLDQGHYGASEQSLGLIMVGSGEPYSSSEISKALGVPVLTTVANDPEPARHLSDGRARPRNFETSSLARSLHSSATSLAAHLQRSTDRIRS
jgi:hypothetical protein